MPSHSDLNDKIDDDEWTLYDKMVYGGLGYGNVCLPTHIFDIILTVIFPPLGIIIDKMDFLGEFPYVHWGTLNKLIEGLGEVVTCLMLTMCFYVPGLVYALNSLSCP